MATTSKVLGYLPSDTPPFGRMVLLGFQHVLTMFPATVLCALLMHFDVSTVLTITGFGTIVALLGSKFAINTYIPLYYGSSFSYIAAVVSIIGVLEPDLAFGAVASPESISVVTAGFLVTGVINVLIGLLIRVTGGKKSLDKILPAEVTGSVAIVIGIGLAYTALTMASGTCCGVEANMAPTLKWWLAALITFLAAVIFSVYLQGKGFIGMLPILLAMILGYVVAIPIGLVDFSTIGASGWITVPKIVFPVFNNALTATALIGVGVMAIATIPESTAHLYQIGLYVDHLAEEQGREKPGLSKHIGLNLMLDGLNDMVNGLFGSTAGTNYGENNSLMVITRNYSGPALLTAGVIAVILGFVGPLRDIIYSIPTAVTGGLAIYLYGVIGVQGIALMMAEKVDLFDPGKLAIVALILVVGIGGNIGYGGNLPIPLLQGVFPFGWPAIAAAAVFGILVNLIFVIVKPPKVRDAHVLE
ncbi:MAG: xanthine permease [Chloroflexi bacterium HGW-Chloroflexi-5]|nr:MAG: xanthine permease [Chloroflexi bacterium HGW-Chloroflexi-5]